MRSGTCDNVHAANSDYLTAVLWLVSFGLFVWFVFTFWVKPPTSKSPLSYYHLLMVPDFFSQ